MKERQKEGISVLGQLKAAIGASKNNEKQMRFFNGREFSMPAMLLLLLLQLLGFSFMKICKRCFPCLRLECGKFLPFSCFFLLPSAISTVSVKCQVTANGFYFLPKCADKGPPSKRTHANVAI